MIHVGRLLLITLTFYHISRVFVRPISKQEYVLIPITSLSFIIYESFLLTWYLSQFQLNAKNRLFDAGDRIVSSYQIKQNLMLYGLVHNWATPHIKLTLVCLLVGWFNDSTYVMKYISNNNDKISQNISKGLGFWHSEYEKELHFAKKTTGF